MDQAAGGSILSVDSWNNSGDVERLDPTTMTWSDAGTLPPAMQGPGTTLGPDMLLPDGRVFVEYGGYASQAKIALYDPATNTWSDGPDVPGGFSAKNTAAAMLTNGHVLFALGTPGGGPVHLFEFDPTAPIDSSLTDVSPAVTLAANSIPGNTTLFGASQRASFGSAARSSARAVVCLHSRRRPQRVVAADDQQRGRPRRRRVSTDRHAVERPVGRRQLQLRRGNGDELSNRRIEQSAPDTFTSHAHRTGAARASPQAARRSRPISRFPAGLPLATYQLTVIANGIASDPVSFTGGFTGSDLAVTNTGPSHKRRRKQHYLFSLRSPTTARPRPPMSC